MEAESIVYQTSELAKKVGVHPNTIRFYEEIKYLPHVSRKANGYRVFTDVHLEQLKLIKIALRCEILQGDLRKKAIEIILLCVNSDYKDALSKTKIYQSLIHSEKERAEEAVQLVHDFPNNHDNITASLYLTRSETAELLDVKIDTLRNWELNGLLEVPRKVNRYRLYTDKEIKELKIIRALRRANYSLMSILRMLSHLRNGAHADLRLILDTPSTDEDIVYVTDRLLTSLSMAEQDASEMIIHILNQK